MTAPEPTPLRDRIAAEFQRLDAHEWGYDHGFCADPDADPETASFVDAAIGIMKAELAQARATNQRLNHQCQRAESNLATIARAVSEWRLGPGGTYVPLRTLNAIAKAVGRQVDETKFELHHQHVERLERERDAAVVQLGRNIPLICSDERHQAKVTALEAELAQALAEIERLRDDLAADDLYADGPPLRPITELPDIATHKEV